VLEPTIYCTQGEHANHYTNDAINQKEKKRCGYPKRKKNKKNIQKLLKSVKQFPQPIKLTTMI
jgi:Zn ribbon nucleic-acid-binding protein